MLPLYFSENDVPWDQGLYMPSAKSWMRCDLPCVLMGSVHEERVQRKTERINKAVVPEFPQIHAWLGSGHRPYSAYYMQAFSICK